MIDPAKVKELSDNQLIMLTLGEILNILTPLPLTEGDTWSPPCCIERQMPSEYLKAIFHELSVRTQ